MATIKLKHVERFKDRYGKIRYYYREAKGKRIALRGEPGTESFNQSYAVAAKSYVSITHSQEGTFNALAEKYFVSTAFLNQRPISQYTTRNVLNRFLAEHGHRQVKQMKRSDVEKLISLKAATPAAANTLLKKLRLLLKLAVRLDWIAFSPAMEIDKFKEGTYHTWTEKEIAKFEKRWPLGCRERVAFDLHLYTGQRRADICGMTDENVLRGNRIEVKQGKTGKELIIPMHPNLVQSLRMWKGPGKAIISKPDGDRYTVESYGNLMADAIDSAKLPARCVLHGLRKAAARRLAEAGCSVHQIAAITGHDSLDEVERYTKAANQEKLADQAMKNLAGFKAR